MRSLMATELMRLCVQEDNEEFPSVPPGFESYTSVSLKRMEDNNKVMTSCSASTSASESQSTQVEAEVQVSATAKVPRSLRRRPWINYGLYDNSSEEDTDSERHGQNFSSRQCLPKGVIRGCPDCSNCQKVVARWHPEDACKPNVEDAPVFYPTEEEFQDTLKYIASIRSKAEPYGICRIVPPCSWKPPCPLKEKSTWGGSKFATRVQRIDKLQNRDSMRKISRIHSNMKRKRRRCTRMGMDNGIIGGPNSGFCESERFGFEPGPEFTLETFQRYADDFKSRYFEKTENVSPMGGNTIMFKSTWEPSVENIEGEYWRMVERPTEEIEVLYGADLETGIFGSGFPRKSGEAESALHEQYIKSGWNLNNFARLPGSVLSYESSDISGVLVPWLYIGMCFSSFCWHVEDHHLYSLNYMHWGAPKLWYGVPGKDACRLEEAMRKHLPDLFEEQPDLLHKLVTQLSPSILKSEGVPVYRCVQNEGEFVLTFPRAYHSGFNCGFNCAEAVNVAPVDWLPHGQIAIELYREQRRKTSISHDKLLLGASREAVRAHWELDFLKKITLDNLRWKNVCGKDGVLAKAFKARIEMERVRREFLSSSSQALKMESTFDATSERECSICYFDLHLSAAGCHCSADRYACLDHAKQFCSCSWDSKFFLFRYDSSELNILADALEGKQSAVYRWAKLDLGLALTSCVSNIEVSNLSHSSRERILQELRFQSSKLSHCSQDTQPKEMALPSSTVYEDSHLVDVPIKSLSKSEKGSYQSYLQQRKISKGVSSSSHTNDLLISNSSKTLSEIANLKNHVKKEPVICDLNLRNPGRQRSQEDISCPVSLPLAECEVKETSLHEHDNIILLSDDEGDESKMPDSDSGKELSKRLTGSHDRASPCNIKENSDLTIPMTDAAVMGEKDNTASPHKDISPYSTHPLHVNKEHHVSRGPVPGTTLVDLSCHIGLTGAGSVENIQASSAGDTRDYLESNSQHSVMTKPKNENNPEKFGGYATSNMADNVRSIIESPSCSSSNLERRFRQKGPRIAKVVRRINCNVEPLEFGTVLSGKSWCNSQAIFPKGFRSRVRYISIIDPTSMCYYVSEILDAGRDGPLFMVSLEHCSSEVFIHTSATRCWELVRDRVNQEITKQHKLGRLNLFPLQPPGSLDGFEMFGFSSPAIVQGIEALDQTRVCNEYWDSRPYSRPQGQIPQPPSRPNETGGKLHGVSSKEANVTRDHLLPAGVDATLQRLFEKANVEELNSLYRIISNNGSVADRSAISQLLNEEIRNRLK